MNDSIKISILFLTYNQEEFVEESLVSVLLQDYPNVEVVVSDDASADRTCSVIDRVLAKHSAANVIVRKSEENTGIAGNVNAAVELSSGDFLVVAAGDDISLPNRLSTYARVLRRQGPKPSAIFTNMNLMDGEGVCSGLFFKQRPSFASTKEEFVAGKEAPGP